MLPLLGQLWDAAVAFDLGGVPSFPGEPQTGRDGVVTLDTLIRWLQGQQPTLAEVPAGLEGLSPAVQQAWRQYQCAIQSRPDLGVRGTDREIYDYLKETLADEKDGFRLPAFDTWQRYLRTARRTLDCRKHNPRHGRPHGPSVVTEDQI
jgi:hypothetical protein